MSGIPEGMHSITPQLVCAGAANAIEFYKRAFGAVELGRMAVPDGRLVYAMIRIGDSTMMLVDEFPEWGLAGPKSLGGSPVTVHLYVEDAICTFRQAEKAGAEVTMPIDDTFWGDRYGKVTDPFGHCWAIATRTRDVSPQDMQTAVDAMFGGEEPRG